MLIETAADFQRRAHLSSSYLWEQYIEGQEFSVEAVTFQGQHHILAITEKVTTGAPHYVEVAHFSPARLSQWQAEQIKRTVERCLSALDIRQGASHTEIKWTEGQAFLIETHTRGGGDRIALLTKLVTGYDQIELAVRSIMGDALPAPEKARYACAGVQYFRWHPGTIEQIEGVEDCQNVPGLIELELTIKAGDRMPEWQDSSDRPGYVVVGGATFEEVETRLQLAEELIRVRYRHE